MPASAPCTSEDVERDLTLAGVEEIEDRQYTQTWFCRVARVDLYAVEA